MISPKIAKLPNLIRFWSFLHHSAQKSINLYNLMGPGRIQNPSRFLRGRRNQIFNTCIHTIAFIARNPKPFHSRGHRARGQGDALVSERIKLWTQLSMHLVLSYLLDYVHCFNTYINLPCIHLTTSKEW